ncbi:MAG: hypothetical protein ACK5NA_08445 [Enterococcus sp.]
MNNFQVMLSDEQSASLKQYIFEITKEAMAEAKNVANIDKDFLKKGEMAKWLGISYNSLSKFEKLGMPVFQIDGLVFFSKEETKKWLMNHQK